MQAEDYEIKHGKRIKFRARGQEKFCSAKRLGERYSEKNIKAQLHGEVKAIVAPADKSERTGISLLIDIENSVKAKQSAGFKHWAGIQNLKMAAMTINYLSDNGLLDYKVLSEKHDEVKGKRDTALSRIKEVENRIKELKSQIKDLDTFRKNKPVVERLDGVILKEKYKREHETEFILFNAAKQSLKAHFPDKKYPLIKTLRAEMNELYYEKNKLYPEYYEARDEYKNISVMKQNVDSIIGRTPHEHERKANQRNKNKSEIE